jgi:hypothetical protein
MSQDSNASPTSAADDPLEKKIISVRSLLSDPSLEIPIYQRPYKWTSKNVQQLFSDIATHMGKPAYRFGTLVFHREDGRRNIVDGQQRTITLLLAARALIARRRELLIRQDLKQQLDALADSMIDPEFTSDISQANIHSNYLEISRLIGRADFTEEHIDFLLNKCEFVTFALSDISEAFQFFDSQNSRGRDLEPHDLLKAFHLREFCPADEPLKANTVSRWESSETEELATLFAQYLYRIRNWSKGESARYFSKEDAGLFKGVNLDTVANYPYVEQLRLTHHFVDNYNHQYERRIDGNTMGFPFHLDQIIINGRRFFEMTAHYQQAVGLFGNGKTDSPQPFLTHRLDGHAARIMDVLHTYEGRHREGDRYVRAIFDCILIYYVDKFGPVEISRAVEKAFIWAYSLRLNMQSVQLASMDNYVIGRNLFQRIKEATLPVDFINANLPAIASNKSTKTGAIENLFKVMGYHEKRD